MDDRSQSRFYFDPLARWTVRAYSALAVLLGLALVLAHIPSSANLSKHHAVLVLVKVGAAGIVVVSVVLWPVVGRVGGEAGTDGIGLSRFGVRHHFLPWGEINAFRSTATLRRSVYAELESGEQVKTALVQGRKMRWTGGASRDIVGVLNSDLARARGQ